MQNGRHLSIITAQQDYLTLTLVMMMRVVVLAALITVLTMFSKVSGECRTCRLCLVCTYSQPSLFQHSIQQQNSLYDTLTGTKPLLRK